MPFLSMAHMFHGWVNGLGNQLKNLYLWKLQLFVEYYCEKVGMI
jgi:hypothetical protein